MSKPPAPPAEPELPSSFTSVDEAQRLVDAEIQEWSLEGVDWTGRDAQGLRLSESELRSVDLTEASLARVRFQDVVVREGSWANATASDASFSRVRFEGVRLTGANLSGCTFDNVTFSECRLDLCSFRFSKMELVRFAGCRMTEADLYEAQVTSVLFEECDLSGVTLTGATFTGSELRGCDLSSVQSPERLRGVRMPWPDVIRSAGELAAGIGIEVLEE